MKGFYFSMDAFTALLVISAMFTFLFVYQDPEPVDYEKPVELDYLNAAQKQPVADWNTSYNSSNTVLEEIHSRTLNSSDSPDSVCSSYFSFESQYALTLFNSSSSETVCGNSSITSSNRLYVSRVALAETNDTTEGYLVARMVVRY